MPQVINTNVLSLNAQRNLNTSGSSLATSLQRLSSGLRINSAKDDAAGLAISERFSTQIRGLNQAARNANDGISLAQTGEGALAEIGNNLQRVRELAVQAANSTNSASDRAALDQEVQQRIAEIERVASQTSFNGQKILDGTFGNAAFQVGANVGETISVGLNSSMRVGSIGGFVNASGTASVTVAAGAAAASGTRTLTTDASSYGGVSAVAFDGAGNFVVNSVNVNKSASYAGVSTDQGQYSAYAKAAAINASGVAGVTASATTDLSFAAASGGSAGASDFLDWTANGAATMSYTLTINGQDVMTATGDTSIATAVSNINQFQSQTGVTATLTTAGKLQLVAADGRDIRIKEAFSTTAGAGGGSNILNTVFSGTTAAANTALTSNAGGSTETYRGKITLQSSAAVNLTGSANASAGFSTTLLSTSGSLATTNVKSVSGANDAILAVDAALTSVSTLRSTLGAIQNRFESTINNLSTASENMTSARSRIQDADFAAETAQLTRAQILQQAGTAILAQANSVPQNVLSLLR